MKPVGGMGFPCWELNPGAGYQVSASYRSPNVLTLQSRGQSVDVTQEALADLLELIASRAAVVPDAPAALPASTSLSAPETT